MSGKEFSKALSPQEIKDTISLANRIHGIIVGEFPDAGISVVAASLQLILLEIKERFGLEV